MPASPDEAGEVVPSFADGEFQKLDTRYITLERIGGMIFAGVVGFIALIVFLALLVSEGVASMPPWIALGAGLLLALFFLGIGLWYPRKAWERTSYAISPLGLKIRRGIWWRHAVEVPRSRIQHTDVQQGPLARSFGLGKLVVYTAGTQHASVELEGLEYGRAMEMRDFLLRGEREDDAT